MKGTCEKSKPPAKYDECLAGYEIVSALQNIEPVTNSMQGNCDTQKKIDDYQFTR